MENIINSVLAFALTQIATYPKIAVALSVLGGIVAIATVVKPLVFWLVAKTDTDKDDRFACRFYDIIEGTALDFTPCVALFRRRNPKAAGVLDKFKSAGKSKDEQSSDT